MKPTLFDPAKDSAATLAALHQTSFPDPWSSTAICELLAGPGVFGYFTRDGFVLARAVAGEGEILTLAVAPHARGQGLGRALLKAVSDHAVSLGAASMFLEVGADNPAALALYASLGFDRVGQRKGYYGSHGAGDAWVLKAQLPLSPGGKFA